MREDRAREIDIGSKDVYKGKGERRGTGRQHNEGVRTMEPMNLKSVLMSSSPQ